ncbi:hypothetical protein J1N35_030107 [Gossypium stocksii]|uniref:Pectinesterase inhibitor domain-containing protein n=1 Tax=Gossypium stocksii TaxID=47602 RepID=A0A9D3UZF8_9ROSI|nr:hypothetical protein J1N35_030107 [Gossypium stocksii]
MMDCLLCDMVTKDGMWNLELFRAWFPKDAEERGELLGQFVLNLDKKDSFVFTNYSPIANKVYSERERNKVVDKLAKVASDRNTEVLSKSTFHPEVIAAMDTTQLGTLNMKLGAVNAKATLNVYNEIIKKPGSPQALKALNCCVEAYKYAILSFEMVSSELVEDPEIANYDVAVISPEIANCEKELINANVQAPRLLAGN